MSKKQSENDLRRRSGKLGCMQREIYITIRSGCAWKLLPHDLPPWKTVYHYYRLWCMDGTWERINTAVRQQVRTQLGRDPQPSAGVIDSQSVKTTGGPDRGYDRGKKVKGRKRHLLVDTQGLVLKAKVHSAGVMDRNGVELLLEQSIKDQLPSLKYVWLDSGYKGEGKGKQWIEAMIYAAMTRLMVKRLAQT